MRVLKHKPTGLTFLAQRVERAAGGPGYSGAFVDDGGALKACGFVPAAELELEESDLPVPADLEGAKEAPAREAPAKEAPAKKKKTKKTSKKTSKKAKAK